MPRKYEIWNTPSPASIAVISGPGPDDWFDFGFGYAGAAPHRVDYTPTDAQHVCDWLNEREAYERANAGDYTLDMIRKRFDR